MLNLEVVRKLGKLAAAHSKINFQMLNEFWIIIAYKLFTIAKKKVQLTAASFALSIYNIYMPIYIYIYMTIYM